MRYISTKLWKHIFNSYIFIEWILLPSLNYKGAYFNNVGGVTVLSVAYQLIMINICTTFCENTFSGFIFTERTWFSYS